MRTEKAKSFLEMATKAFSIKGQRGWANYINSQKIDFISVSSGQNVYFESHLPLFVRHSIIHCRQRFDWDCGVTCVMMLLTRQKRQDFLRNFNQICETEGFGTR